MTALSGSIQIWTKTAAQWAVADNYNLVPLADQVVISKETTGVVNWMVIGNGTLSVNDLPKFQLLSYPLTQDNDINIVSGSDVVKKGSNILLASPWLRPLKELYLNCDFDNTGDALVGVTSTVSSGTLAVVACEANHPGVVLLGTGSSASGRSLLVSGLQSYCPGVGEMYLRWIVKTGGALSSSLQRYIIRCGFLQSIAADGTGVYFRYSDNISGGSWECVTRILSDETVTDTDIAVAADTWYTLEVRLNADSSAAEFYINGTLVATHTDDIPSGAGQEFSNSCFLGKSIGTSASNMRADRYDLLLKFDRS